MSSKYSHIDHLIAQYLSGVASEQEKAELDEWILASPLNKQVFDELKKVWHAPPALDYHDGMDAIRDQIWEVAVGEGEEKGTLFRKLYRFPWRAAAAVFILVMGGLYFYRGGLETNRLSMAEKPAVWIEKESLAGKRSVYFLPDGTKAWLNAGSTIGFSENFSDTLRYVRLQGEAFFEVVKDHKRPFIVEANGVTVQALGTAFNVAQEMGETETTVALVEGKVKVENKEKTHTVILKPGQELVASESNTVFATRKFDADETVGWKDGILVLKQENFSSFCRKIEKWYGVKIVVKGSAPDDWHIMARYQHESLHNVLKDLSFNKKFQYKIEGETVSLSF
mgnify:CR=1 FL=1